MKSLGDIEPGPAAFISIQKKDNDLALQFSQNSRKAVLPIYLCFNSKAVARSIRFNLSLNKLYWNVFASVTKTTIFDFLEQLNPIETASLQNIPVDATPGVYDRQDLVGMVESEVISRF
jgi:hypothetical protein